MTKYSSEYQGNWSVSVAPASEPLTPTEVKNYLKVDYTTDDDLITILIEAARQEAEKYTSTAIITQTIVEKFDEFPTVINLSVSPVTSVTSVQYEDGDGDTQTLAAANYVVDTTGEPARIAKAYAQTWPTLRGEINDVTVTYVAGYADAASVPAGIKQALLLSIADWYEQRQDRPRRILTTQSTWLLDQYKVKVF